MVTTRRWAVRRTRLREAVRHASAGAQRGTATAARRLIPTRLRATPTAARWRTRLSPPTRSVLEPVLEAVSHARPRVRFIQVGSNDGEQQDPLHDAIRRFGWAGIMVEPVPFVFERLQRTSGALPGVALENVAIAGSDGEAAFHHLSPATDGEVPAWYDGLGSFSLDVIRSHRHAIPDIDDRIVTTVVPTMTFDSLCAAHGVDRLDVLHVDTEGYDGEILRLVDFERLRPIVVVYEHHHLAPEDRAACRALLEAWGYDLVEYGLDTWAFNPERLDDAAAQVTAVWRAARERAETAMARA